ncbi:MAG: hypothetical protein ABFD00_08100 [Chloroherpetonaceae bacterium]
MKKPISLSNSVVNISERTGDGNIKPEARERIINVLKNYLSNAGHANICEISLNLGLSRQTVKNLIDEILIDWHQEIQEESIVQSKWMESVLKDIDQNPTSFSKEKIAIVNLKSSLLGKLNALQKLALKKENSYQMICLVKKNEISVNSNK